MANLRSSLKRYKQSLKARARNRAMKSRVKKAIKKVRAFVEQKDKEQAYLALKEANSILDKAASKGVIHRRNAARRISRLAKLVNSMS